MKTKFQDQKEKRFEMVMSDEHFKALTRLSLNESVRLQQHVSRADWIRQQIEKKAQRKSL